MDLLRRGASPERLAWSIAAGLLIGINPLLGSTTVLCLAAALVFRLNIAASQLGNHIVYPLQLALVIPFLRLGSALFHTEPMPLSPHTLLESARTHPVDLIRQLWRWESHALIVWVALSAVLIPAFAIAMTPLLRRLMVHVRRQSSSRPV
jgi:uncharacterized protein (DUF2062 family)